eukprot:518741_1
MDATAMSKLKELVTSRRFKEAEILLSDYLLKSPNDYALLMHMGGIQTSMFKYNAAEEYYKKAILIGKRQSGSAKVQLMRIYSTQSRDKDLILLLLKCLETESKSITLKEQIIQIYMKIYEYKSALIYSRELIEQIKEINKLNKSNKTSNIQTDERKKSNERAKILSDPMKQSDFYFLHCQILNKVGRFSDSIIYCKKAIEILTEWINTLPMQQKNMILNAFGGRGMGSGVGLMMGSNNKQSMEYNKRMNRYYGYLGLCYLHVDDINNALNSFKKAKNINNMDRIATTNIKNISHNRSLFDKCVELKTLYKRFMVGKLAEEEKEFDLKAKFMEYIKLLIQQNRLFIAELTCNRFLNENISQKQILGYDTPEFIIIYEDILRQQMNNMNKNMLQNNIQKMDKKRNQNGPQYIQQKRIQNQNNNDQNDQKQQKNDIKDLPDKIWEIRAKIDYMYSRAIELSPTDVNLHIAYALSLWRIGYDSKGIEMKTHKWSEYNANILVESKYYLSRGNAFINEDNNKKAMIELRNALNLCIDKNNNDNDNTDEIQTRLLMTVTLNKMNKL